MTGEIEMRVAKTVTWLMAAGCMLAVGCGAAAQVKGTVTLDGKPLEVGHVAFHPVDKGPVAMGEIEEGAFVLKTGTREEVAAGEYIVTVEAREETSPEKAPKDKPPPPPKLLTPQKYSNPKESPLRVTVKQGKNDIPLELMSK